MNQENYIEDSKVMGSVYNNVENIRISPIGYSNLLACKNIVVNGDGKVMGSDCILRIPKESDKFIRDSIFHDNNPLYSNDDFKNLFEGSKWMLKEIK